MKEEQLKETESTLIQESFVIEIRVKDMIELDEDGDD